MGELKPGTRVQLKRDMFHGFAREGAIGIIEHSLVSSSQLLYWVGIGENHCRMSPNDFEVLPDQEGIWKTK